jgi:alpha-D-ribose 1-methylphosphonate 5-phosphate C-P lyase
VFKESSRYAKQKTVEVKLASGRSSSAVTLRRLPPTEGVSTELKANDRLDVIALRKYKDSAKFWHIADTNTELQVNDLVKNEPSDNPLVSQAVRSILVPEK